MRNWPELETGSAHGGSACGSAAGYWMGERESLNRCKRDRTQDSLPVSFNYTITRHDTGSLTCHLRQKLLNLALQIIQMPTFTHLHLWFCAMEMSVDEGYV